MKKMLSLMLCLVLLLSLCACGTVNPQSPTVDDSTEDFIDVPLDELDKLPAYAPTDIPADTQEGTLDGGADIEVDAPSIDASDNELAEVARGLIGKPVSELYAQIGEPVSSDYAPSCMGDGEDGMLLYDGFIVYTYREGESESVYDVE